MASDYREPPQYHWGEDPEEPLEDEDCCHELFDREDEDAT